MYQFSATLTGDFNEIEQNLSKALASEGFGVLTEIDVQATMKKKLGIDKPAYKILGACNPGIANQAIDLDADIGLLLPCNIVLRATEEGSVVVAFMDPVSVFELAEQPALTPIAEAVKEKLQSVLKQLTN